MRAARGYAGLSVSELAAAIGVGAQTIKRIEAGRRAPRKMEIWAIADVCGLPLAWFSADWKSCCQQAEALTALVRRVEDGQAQILAHGAGGAPAGDESGPS